MLASQLLLPTLKETPADAETVSHRLMLRAGLIRQLATGLYTWLPLGLRVLRKVEEVVREEMNRTGAQELLMPAVQPAELWQESGRWDQYGPELLRIKDRHERDYCFGPTHEEVITDLVRREIRSYRQLPATFYQIQTKFRDEIRPRFGVMRAREFIMKDAYSFHLDATSLDESYARMHDCYSRIFSRLGLEFRAVAADSGSIGGQVSHEFHVLASSGEDILACATDGAYAANIELAEALPPAAPRAAPEMQLQSCSTPEQRSIAEVADFLGVAPERCLKTLLVKGSNGGVVALVLRGDHELNVVKAAKLEPVAAPLAFADEQEIRTAAGCAPGFIGPVGLDVPVIADHSACRLSDFVCGANRDGHHYTGGNWERDCPEPQAADIRNVVAGDPSPDGHGTLTLTRGIEVGHIFQLGTKYSVPLKASCLDEHGKSVTLTMGCYGIGISRIVAAAIEQHQDEHGIIWPLALAPFQTALLPLNMHKSQRLRTAATELYQRLVDAGIDTLMDDRRERPGVMFANADLIGIPHRLVFNETHLDEGIIEYKRRDQAQARTLALAEIVDFLKRGVNDADY